MTEVYPSDNDLLNLVSEAETGVEYIATGLGHMPHMHRIIHTHYYSPFCLLSFP